MNVLGIDPGKDGFLCLCDGDRKLTFWPTPTVKVKKKSTKRDYDLEAMRRILSEAWHMDDTTTLTVLEKQQPMPDQGVTSMFSIGYGYGLWHGLLVGMGMPFMVVHPRTWQAQCCRDIQGDVPKTRALLAAQRIFPGVDWRLSERAKKAHDGKVDSALIAWYGMMFYAGRGGLK